MQKSKYIPLINIKNQNAFKLAGIHVEYTNEKDIEILQNLSEFGFAVVGTRRPHPKSFELIENVFKQIKGSKLIIVSGLAKGIDAEAHELAIKYGLKTIGILGCGLNEVYPQETHHLRKKITEAGGLVLSPFHENTKPFKSNFLERNELIAGFSKATWVVEGNVLSGSLNTAKHALHFGKDLYVTPCFPGDPSFSGNELLLKNQTSIPFYEPSQLMHTWPEFQKLSQLKPIKRTLKKIPELHAWIKEIESTHKHCHLQALSTLASERGMKPDQLYPNLQKNIDQGLIEQDLFGHLRIL